MTTFRTMVLMRWLVVLLVTSSTLVPVLSTLETNLQTITLLSLLPAGCRVNSCSFIDYEESTSLSGTHSRILAHLNPTNAETWLKRTTENDSSYLSHFELCRHYWSQNQTQQAVDACHKVPNVGHYWIRLGIQADQDRQPKKTLAYFQMATYSDPDLPEAWYRLGRVLFAERDFLGSSKAFSSAIELGYPASPGLYLEWGRSYQYQNNGRQARKVFKEGLSQFSENRNLYWYLAGSYLQESNLEIADLYLQMLLDKFPTDGAAWEARGQIALQQDKTSEALAYFQNAVYFSPERPGFQLNLARTAVRMDKLNIANLAYEQVLQMQPANISVWIEAGEYYLATNQELNAKQTFEHILALEPNNARAMRGIEQLSEN